MSKLGIGTDSPQGLGHVVGDNNISSGTSGIFMDIQNLSTTAGSMSGLRFKAKESVSTGYYHSGIFFKSDGSSLGYGDMYFVNRGDATGGMANINDYARMVITKDGNVGIGTTNPVSAFQIDSYIAFFNSKQ